MKVSATHSALNLLSELKEKYGEKLMFHQSGGCCDGSAPMCFPEGEFPLGDNDVKISDRLYLPSRKLRGFETGKIGPKDGSDYVGGNFLSAFNAQANLPFMQSFETIDLSIFYDAANVWCVDYNSNLDDSSALRSSTGVAIDWYTPIGPLSFSFSQPLTKKSSDKTESFRFQLGTTF